MFSKRRFTVVPVILLLLVSCGDNHCCKFITLKSDFTDFSSWRSFADTFEKIVGEKFVLPVDDELDLVYTVSYTIDVKEEKKDILQCNLLSFVVSASVFLDSTALTLFATDATPYLGGEPSHLLVYNETETNIYFMLDGNVVLQMSEKSTNNVSIYQKYMPKIFSAFSDGTKFVK